MAAATPDLDFFACPACGGQPGAVAGSGASCSGCGARYEIRSGIPLLVEDWQAHEEEIEGARQVNPLWYREEQLLEQASPWRHHLRKRRRYVERVIRAYLGRIGKQRAPRLLDLGCGDGTNLVWLREFADRLYGSDYNLVRLARAQARVSDATLFLGDILRYPSVDGWFDVIFFNHVIEHIPDDLKALETVRRILKPGGLLVLGTPNEGCWWWQHAYRRAPEVLEQTDHVHFYTALTIEAKMRKAGFQMLETRHLGWGPPDWHLDGRLRQHKILDDLFELAGRVLLPRQASSLYLIATRT